MTLRRQARARRYQQRRQRRSVRVRGRLPCGSPGQLSGQHGADAGMWFLEAGFGLTAVRSAPLFLDLDAAQDWIERHLGTKRVGA
jgi:hypothetical protein